LHNFSSLGSICVITNCGSIGKIMHILRYERMLFVAFSWSAGFSEFMSGRKNQDR
jgi:hypothetical protein